MFLSYLAPNALVTALAFVVATSLGCAHPAAPAQPAQAAIAAATGSTPSPKETIVNEGRRWTKAFYEGRTQEMWDRMTEGYRKLSEDKAGFDAFRTSAIAQLGAETAVVEERTEQVADKTAYVRIARFERVPMPMRVAFGFDGEGRIVAFGIQPESTPTSEAPTDKLDYATRTALHLPFDGAWKVFWGGRKLAQNHHAATRDQRFAYDFVVVKDGSTHAGDGTRNTDYYAYGRPVLAPAAGRVVVAVDGVPENVPGQVSAAANAAGNYVVIDHGDGEFSFLAHLVLGSLKVRVGDRVAAGQALGDCGNSGHSSEPHLHYHLQDTQTLFEGAGLPAPWVDYLADGRPVARGEATRGQVIEPAGARVGQGS